MPIVSNSDLVTRSQACTLKVFTNLPASEIQAITGVGERQQRRLVQKAKERGWNTGKPLLNCHLDDAPRSGRPSKSDKETTEKVVDEETAGKVIDEETTEKVSADVRQNRATRTHRL